MERTLVVIKPDAIQRGLIGEIIHRFERVGLKMIGAKLVHPDKNHYFEHYEKIGNMISRRGKETFDITLDYVMEGPVLAMVFEGIDSVMLVRKMVGETEPHKSAPGTIRGDYAHMTFNHSNASKRGLPNIVHASGNRKEAAAEIKHWFSEAELFDYETVHDKYTVGKDTKN